MSEITKEMADKFGRELIDRGLVIEAGYVGYKLMFAPKDERRERRAFLAGAQHLFATIMNSALDEGAEPTDGDFRRMDGIAAEMKKFEAELLRESTH